MINFDSAATAAARPVPTCVQCPVKAFALYAPFGETEMGAIQGIRRDTRKLGPRQMIMSAGERFATVATVYEGWAYRFMLLPDGRRQILSYYLPGDFIAVEAFQDLRPHFSIKTLTSVTLCTFESKDFRRLLDARPVLMNQFIELCGRRSTSIDNRLMDLGRRTARERLIRLIIHLYGRLVSKDISEGNAFSFPLRYAHIADTIGLTSVHISRTMSALRRDKLIDLRGSRMILLNEAELLHQAGLTRDYIAEKREAASQSKIARASASCIRLP